MVLPLFLKTFKDQRRGFIGWCIGAIAIISIQLSVFPTVRSSAEGLNTFIENYPEALQKIFRMEDYTSGTGYLSAELFSFMLPLVFIAVGAAWGANAIAQEEERRTADVLLTLPIARTRVLVTKILSAFTAQVMLALVIFFTLFIGIRFVDISIAPTKILAASFSCSLLGIIFNAVATLFGSIFGKKSIALGGAIALAFAGFLFYSLAPLVHTFDRVLGMNPFQWALGKNSLITGLDFGYTTRSILATLAIYGASIFVLRRRDISS
ncbi:MAG: ABC transporter permease subunit [Candidatus Nanopelagicaceae bacterium]|jgi:ABC-2 type transport system permease protein